MATYTKELDGALLPVPWTAKVDASSKPFMLKYAPYPSKPGYITLLTDLNKVYFEPLAGIRLLARQREVEEQLGQSQSQRDGGSSLDLGGEEAVEEVLQGIADLMSGLENAELEIKPGDLYDLDVTIKSADSNWLFHMTEIRYGAVEVITKHILHPMALTIASSRRPASSTNDQIVELVSSHTVLEAVNRHSLHLPRDKVIPNTVVHPSPKKKTANSPPPAEPVDTEEKAGEGSKTRLVRRRPGASKPDSPPSPKQVEEKSVSPVKQRTKKVASRVATEEEEDESMPPEEEDGRLSTSPVPSPPRSRKKQAVTPPPDDDQEPEDHSPTPPAPSAPSQKTQQEKDDEEEEILAKKREEMKRRMGAGGGGRLVRRRFG